MRSIYWAVIIPTALFLSCRSNHGSPTSDIFIDSFAEESNMDYFRDVYSDIRVVPLNLGDHLLGSTSTLRVDDADGRFLLTDRQTGSIYLLNKDGSLGSYIAKVGRGPGEYSEIQHAIYRNHRVIVLADGSHIIEYTESGEMVREAVFDEWITDITPLGEDEYALFLYRNSGENDIEDRIIITDSAFVKKQSFLPLAFQLFSYGALTSRVTGQNDQYICVQQSSPLVYKCNRDTILTTYHFDFHGKEYPKPLLESDDYETILNILTTTPVIYSVANVFESPDYLLFVLCQLIDGEESRIGQWLIEKESMTSRLEYQNLSGPVFQFFGPPQMLTADKEVVYVCEASLFETVKDFVPGLSKLQEAFDNNPFGNVILFCTIGE